MLTPEDVALAQSLLRSGRVDADALQKQISLLTAASSTTTLSEALEQAGLLKKGEAGGFSATVLPGGGGKASFDRTVIPGQVVAGEAAGARRKFGRYEIVRELARGGMGVIYEGWEPALARRVAIKVLIAGEGATQEQIDRFQREARSAAGLQHPNIIAVYDVGQTDGVHYFAMELVDGKSLDAVIKEEGPLPPRRALRIALEAARALHYAHGKGIIHRDVKPGNILLAAAGETSLARSLDGAERAERVLLGDFGLAKEMSSTSSLTISGNLIGTPAYMSPEQAGGHVTQIDARSDVYSLGAVLYEALTGKTPVTGTTLADVLTDIRSMDAIPVRKHRPGIHRDVELIVQKAMMKEKERRYQTAGEFADDIERWLTGEGVVAAPPTLLYRLSRFTRRRRAAVLSALVCFVSIAGLGGWLGWRVLRDRRAARARAEADRGATLAAARAHVAKAQERLDAGDFEGAIVEAGLADAAMPGFPEAAQVSRASRLRRFVQQANEEVLRTNWKGAQAVLEAASDFRDDPEIAGLARLCRGTCSLEIAAEAGLSVDIADAVPGVWWDEETFPAIDEARREGVCVAAGTTPLPATDLDFGDHFVVLGKNGRAVRVLPVRLARSTELKAEYRVYRVGRGPGTTHETIRDAVAAARPGAVIELAAGTHAFGGIEWKPGLRICAVPGSRATIQRSLEKTILTGKGLHGLSLARLDFEGGAEGGLILAESFGVSVADCTIGPAGTGSAVVFRDCDAWLVRDTAIQKPSRDGIYCENCTGGLALRVSVSEAGHDGILLQGTSGLGAVLCRVDGAWDTGISITGSDARVIACRVSRARRWGISATSATDLVVRDNVISESCTVPKPGTPASLLIMFCERLSVDHNTVVGGAGNGFCFMQSIGWFAANIAAGVKGRGFHYHGGGLNSDSPDTRLGFDWLLVWKCESFGRFWELEFATHGDVLAHDRVNGSTGWRPLEHVVLEDPKFVNEESGDFRLAEGSPARGRGPDGSDYGARPEAIAAEDLPARDWLVRDGGRRALTAAEQAAGKNDLAAARRLARIAALLLPGDPRAAALLERLK